MSNFLNLIFLAIVAFLPPTIHARSEHICGREHERLPNLESAAVKKATPYYPNEPGFHVRGKVVIKVKVDRHGDVSSASALCGHPLLYAWAIRAAKDWKFTPRVRRARPVSMTGIITFDFPAVQASESATR